MGRPVLRRGPRPHRPGPVRAGRSGLIPAATGRAHRSGRRLLPTSRYADQPWSTRAHVRGRWAACPFAAIEAEVPRRGAILDVGCGHGLLCLDLAERAPERGIVGVDIDEAKLASARAAAAVAPALDNVSFLPATALAAQRGPFAAITVVDVLYLLPPRRQEELVTSLAARLGPRGRLLVKEMAPRPRWKHHWMHAQEVIATRLVRITASDHATLHFTTPTVLAGWMADAGLTVDRRRLDRGRPYPHHLVVGTAGAGR